MKELLKLAVTKLPNKWQVYLNFRVRVGYFLSLKNPKGFNEKIQHRKLYDNNPLFTLCSDKLLVRQYVKDKIGEQYLIPLLYSGDNISISTLKSIESDYVVKTTHDSGGLCVVDKNKTNNYQQIKQILDRSLAHDFGKQVTEPWYSKIEPKIIVEKMLKGKDGGVPKDFKFHVYTKNGKQKIILNVDYDRFTDEHSRTYYDEELNILPFTWSCEKNYFKELKEVANYQQMLSLVKKLAEDFDYVRVDLYNVDGQIYFGELTFAPGSGFEPYCDKKYDFMLGDYWDYPKSKSKATHKQQKQTKYQSTTM
ncbi:ATP-grasp fold amidoligase family protein [Marinicellulosiphila megalodicopiae]|uniref:ATP-grasp fold amidoligase family protein n=1 Tax=Marinicellulosiphila megalodicopiae TaxID=2724896 RepID=UPI003BAFD450